MVFVVLGKKIWSTQLQRPKIRRQTIPTDCPTFNAKLIFFYEKRFFQN